MSEPCEHWGPFALPGHCQVAASEVLESQKLRTDTDPHCYSPCLRVRVRGPCQPPSSSLDLQWSSAIQCEVVRIPQPSSSLFCPPPLPVLPLLLSDPILPFLSFFPSFYSSFLILLSHSFPSCLLLFLLLPTGIYITQRSSTYNRKVRSFYL